MTEDFGTGIYRSRLQNRFTECLKKTGQSIEQFLKDNRDRQHEDHSSDAINEVDLATITDGMKIPSSKLDLLSSSPFQDQGRLGVSNVCYHVISGFISGLFRYLTTPRNS